MPSPDPSPPLVTPAERPAPRTDPEIFTAVMRGARITPNVDQMQALADLDNLVREARLPAPLAQRLGRLASELIQVSPPPRAVAVDDVAQLLAAIRATAAGSWVALQPALERADRAVAEARGRR
jgi:hypothetical protein